MFSNLKSYIRTTRFKTTLWYSLLFLLLEIVIGILVYFYLGDSIFGENILAKYKIPYVYDVREFKNTLGRITTVQADFFVPSHGEIVETIEPLAGVNRKRSQVLGRKAIKRR